MDKVFVSRQCTGKMTGVLSINTTPLSNPFCNSMCKTDTVCRACYARKLFKGAYKGSPVEKRYERNGWLLSKGPLNVVPKFHVPFVRIHSFGEIINLIHAENLLRIVQENPATVFAWWTKRRDMIDALFEKNKKPINLILVYSEPKIDRMDLSIPKFFDKVFGVYSKDAAEKTKINCGAKRCNTCAKCYTHGGDAIIRERLKE